MSTIYGVGVGPGDPELLTLKAAKIIAQSQVLAVPKVAKDTPRSELLALSIAAGAVDISGKQIVELYMPMTRDQALLAQSHNEAADVLQALLKQGKTIAFLTLGDPSVYSTYMYVHELLQARGITPQIIAGVPSFCAAAARLGIALVKGGEQLHIIPGSYTGHDSCYSGTTVLMKTGKALPEVKERLRAQGLYQNAKLVHKCGLAGERVCHSLDEADEEAGYFSLIIARGNK